jgi:regulator of protease activity HflC (stomatin/prohibitin superfamily)
MMKKEKSKMRKSGFVGGIISAVVILLAIICTVLCVERLPVGYVGVVYSPKGVEEEILTKRWNFVAPWKTVKEFTVSNEQLLLTKDERKGSEGDDSFKVATSDDASISISFQMSYRYIESDVVNTYKKFKGMDGETIVESRVKTVLKSKVSEVTTDYSMMDIYSGNRSEINNKITEYLNEEFNDTYGIEVIDASIIDVHPDDKLKEAIDNRVTALQQKQQAEAEQEKVKVEAETAKIKAENEAAIKIMEAQAEAEANRLLSNSITPELIQMKEAEARLEHGWITVTGNGTVVTDAK